MSYAKAFEGIKVAEFTNAIMGPLAGKYFADYGATVVRLESSAHPDIIRVSPPFKPDVPRINASAFWTQYNTGKRDLSLDLRRPEAREVARRLVQWCDVFIQNFTAGVLEKLGLSQEEIRSLNPSAVVISMTNLGRTGPYARQPGLGPQLQAISGLDSLLGWSDGGPNNPHGAIPDMLGSMMGVVALVAALDYRRRTGKGQFIDLSQYEVTCSMLSPWLLEREANGHEKERSGNADPNYAPHAVYPCQGQERWCAIAVCSEEEWAKFCQVSGLTRLVNDPRFANVQARKAHEAELNAIITDWTKDKTAEEVMWACQKAGVAAGVVNTCADLYEDAQLRHRKHFQVTDHPAIGPHSVIGQPSILSATPAEIKRAPLLGEHNEIVIKDLLGMSDEQYVKLLVDGVLK